MLNHNKIIIEKNNILSGRFLEYKNILLMVVVMIPCLNLVIEIPNQYSF